MSEERKEGGRQLEKGGGEKSLQGDLWLLLPKDKYSEDQSKLHASQR